MEQTQFYMTVINQKGKDYLDICRFAKLANRFHVLVFVYNFQRSTVDS